MHTLDAPINANEPPLHADAESPYNMQPFNDALALVEKSNKNTSAQNFLLKVIGIPAIAICVIIAALNGIKPDHVYVKTVTIYCYLVQRGGRAAHINLQNPPPCDATTTNIADLLPLQADPVAQQAIAQNLLPIFVREAFSITGAQATVQNVSDMVTPYLQKNSSASTFFMDYYKSNNVAKLAVSQTNNVSVDPIPRPQVPGEYIVGYTVSASNGTQSTSNHYLAKVDVVFGPPTGTNIAGMYIYSFALDSEQPAQSQ